MKRAHTSSIICAKVKEIERTTDDFFDELHDFDIFELVGNVL